MSVRCLALASYWQLHCFFSIFACFYGSAEIENQVPQLAEYRVGINSDRWVEFANLPSIGKKTAQSIVEYGQAIGGYRSVDQLLEVKGVGEKTLARIRRYIISMHPSVVAERDGLTSH